MRLQVERSGGITGRTLRWTLDTDGLDPDGQEEVRALVAQSADWGRSPAAGADRFSYRLLAEPGDPSVAGPLDVRFGEPLPPAAQRLLQVVRDAPPAS